MERPRSGSPLLEAARNGDMEAVGEIFDLFGSAIYKYTRRLVDDSILADNVTGDVFAKLLEQFGEGKGPNKNLRSYLYQTAYHLVVDVVRAVRHNAPIELGEEHGFARGDTTIKDVEENALMEQAVQSMNTELTDDQRHVIILRFLEDFSLKETAAIMGKEVNNIKVIQNRGIAKLRKAMGINLNKEEDSAYGGMPLGV